MKIFVSWSGSQSQAFADFFSQWIKCVLHASEPWVSTRDIDRGALWFSQIGDQLRDTTIGVICLTKENRNRPWILFEAGALAKGLSSSRVCTILLDLVPADLIDPLAQFNHTIPNREGMLSLVRTLNSTLGSGGLDERTLGKSFEAFWPEFDRQLQTLLRASTNETDSAPRSNESLLVEILENTRHLSTRLRQLESNLFDGTTLPEAGHESNLRARKHALEELQRLDTAGVPDAQIAVELERRGLSRSWTLRYLAELRGLKRLESESSTELQQR